ncbi:MAG: 30S ribosomal protein S5 [Puniceicoccales bacterium]|jgi:small subunit ribosomal protein S5|nr:30S ribosomal protein S5 [Puniceicoccales bacterium]
MDARARRRFSRDDRRGPPHRGEKEIKTLEEKVVHIGRCSKVVSGGRRFSFSALVIVGNRMGRIGFGTGRAREVPEAVRKAIERASRNLNSFALTNGTIPHTVVGVSDGGCVLLKPASAGTGIVAGGVVRSMLELCGIKNALSKSMRSSNPHATVRATFAALKKLRSREMVYAQRGIHLPAAAAANGGDREPNVVEAL